ncbi:hypothetical protein PPTG_23311 [Phytophthora nicotianae INRA-310]|uniref:Uncharacterized protein n=1 Tax=Phytophthora nicotianae (strain INRA-310) TaxID=761204 RepID=W2Q1S9_PHYN3|nr:hypothetical protein PPTG_23311 [Phytophthora nicotianae INRA-310]ETN06509.1 hypothetical protein PPTG_23311 [Phytophthora nicotianae INRA-310]
MQILALGKTLVLPTSTKMYFWNARNYLYVVVYCQCMLATPYRHQKPIDTSGRNEVYAAFISTRYLRYNEDHKYALHRTIAKKSIPGRGIPVNLQKMVRDDA